MMPSQTHAAHATLAVRLVPPQAGNPLLAGKIALPGSKSISMPLFTKKQLEEMSESEKEGKLPELLPGSKIGILRLPTKESDPPVQIKPKLLPGSKSGALDLIPEERDKSK